MRVGVRGAGAWTLTYGDQTFPVDLAAPAGSEEVGFMAPPSWSTTVAAAPDEVLVARLTVPLGERFALAGLIAEDARISDDDAIAAAALAARDAETAVVVVGLTAEQETEAVDKATLALPGRQDELVAAVAAAARRTVVVVNAATPILMPWLDDVDALLWVGLPGQEGGHAVADVLLGRAEPTGRLVTTFPAADGDGPAWSVTPVDGRSRLHRGHPGRATAAGTAVRWRRRSGSARAWAGVAGSTPRRRTRLGAGRARRSPCWSPTPADRPAREVVQVYWRPADPEAPVRLVGYAVADEVVPGEERSVAVTCDARAFRLWDTDASSGRRRPAAPCCWLAGSATYASSFRGPDPGASEPSLSSWLERGFAEIGNGASWRRRRSHRRARRRSRRPGSR